MTDGIHVERYVVVGAAGSIGGLVARLLAAEGQWVDCIDLRIGDNVVANTAGLHWIEADILAPTPEAADALRQADTVVCATSLELLGEAMPTLLKHLSPDCALIETLSIKSPFADLLERGGHALGDREVAGINPMFSGDLDPVGRPAAVVVYGGRGDRDDRDDKGDRDNKAASEELPVREGPRARALFDVLRRAGLVIVPIDPRGHDRSMAALQTIVHGAVLAFGDVLCDASLDIDALLALAPPPFRVMFSLLARMTRNHPDVYWEIQTQNPFAGDARQALIGALQKLDQTCADGKTVAFKDSLARIDAELVRSRPETVALSKQIFDIVNKPV